MKFPLLSLALAPLAAAHFQLQYPTSRGFDEDTMPEFPCGGMSQSSNRTQLPISGSFPVALKMGHSQTAVEVLLALGSNPGDNYNITLVHTFQVTGLGAFCLPHVEFSSDVLGVNITDGMNATLQVQSNGDPSGGLYAVSFEVTSDLGCPILEVSSWVMFANWVCLVRRRPILLQRQVLRAFFLHEQHQRRCIRLPQRCCPA